MANLECSTRENLARTFSTTAPQDLPPGRSRMESGWGTRDDSLTVAAWAARTDPHDFNGAGAVGERVGGGGLWGCSRLPFNDPQGLGPGWGCRFPRRDAGVVIA